jgi:hypothetical protein
MMRITGGCHCGNIAFEAEIDDQKVMICHCSDCQKLSGTAFRTVVISEPNGVSFTKGKAKEYVKIAESGNERAQGFCGNCGSALYATTVDENNRVYGLRVGTIDQRNELIPHSQIWHRSSVPWLDKINSVTAFETTPKK